MNVEEFSKVEKILYQQSYDFHIKFVNDNTEEAHKSGLDKVKSVRKLSNTKQTWVDLTTGKKHKANY